MSDIKVGDVDRERFESWYIQNWHDGDIHPHQSLLNHKPNEDDEYVSQAIQNMWEAWQAASSLIPEGFAIVPIEPTQEMMIHISGESWHESRENYYKLLKAAPKPTDK